MITKKSVLKFITSTCSNTMSSTNIIPNREPNQYT